MRDGLFRKDPLKKISTPDRTDQLIVQPRLPFWIILVSLLVILAVLSFGLLNITLVTTVDGNGIFLGNTSHAAGGSFAGQEVILFIPFAEGQEVRPGMGVHVSPLSKGRDEYEYFEGTVANVTRWPVTRGEVVLLLNNNSDLADYYLSHISGPPLVARVTLNPLPGEPGSLVKSGQVPTSFVVREGAPCMGQIIISRHKAFEKISP